MASANDVILWFGENPCRALLSELFPPERAPSGSAPVGVRPFNCRTDSDSSLEIGGEIKCTSVLKVDTNSEKGCRLDNFNSPQYGEHSRHLSDCSDFVLDDLLALVCLNCNGKREQREPVDTEWRGHVDG